MRKDLLIASLVILILGLAISGMIGSIILAVGILLLLYVIFSKEDSREADAAVYLEPDYHRETARQSERKPKQYEEPKPRYRNVDRAERELRAWGSDNKGKKCSECGSTSNPANAKFCADCGNKL